MERADELCRSVWPGEAMALLEGEPEIQADAPSALWEGEKMNIALGSGHLHLLRPVVCAVDQQTREGVVGRILLQLEAQHATYHRVAAVRADEQAGGRGPAATVTIGEGNGRRAQADIDLFDAPMHAGTGGDRRVEKHLTGVGMALGHGTLYPGNEVKRQARRLSLRRVYRLVIADVAT